MERETIYFKFKKEDQSNFTLNELIYALKTTKTALEDYYKRHNITDKKTLNELSPEIVNVTNGCISFEMLLTGVVTELLVIGIVKSFKLIGSKIISKIDKDKRVSFTFPSRKTKLKWDYSDDFAISIKILKKYVLEKASLGTKEFIKELKLSKNYSTKSIEDKIENTKQLLKESNITNTLRTSCLPHYSKQHKRAFIDARIELKI